MAEENTNNQEEKKVYSKEIQNVANKLNDMSIASIGSLAEMLKEAFSNNTKESGKITSLMETTGEKDRKTITELYGILYDSTGEQLKELSDALSEIYNIQAGGFGASGAEEEQGGAQSIFKVELVALKDVSQKIAAIKELRALLGLDLKGAKEIVDNLVAGKSHVVNEAAEKSKADEITKALESCIKVVVS